MRPCPESVEVLEEVCELILARAEQFDMHYWISAPVAEVKEDDSQYEYIESAVESCGTTACIAGWTVSVKYPQCRFQGISFTDDKARAVCALIDDVHSVAGTARDILRITRDQGSKLFYLDFWPFPFGNQYRAATTPQERAAAAVARIQYFIHTGE